MGRATKSDVGVVGVADVNGTVSFGGNTVIGRLTNFANARTIMVTLFGVNDGVKPIGNVSVPMSVLAGDTSGNGTVSSADVSDVKNHSGQAGARPSGRYSEWCDQQHGCFCCESKLLSRCIHPTLGYSRLTWQNSKTTG